MYSTLLIIHSLFRWLVLISLIYAIYRFIRGYRLKVHFSSLDNTVRRATVAIAHIQLVLGVCLYFISPIIAYFLANLGESLSLREIRFFGMEHSLMMFLAIVCISIGSIKAKRESIDGKKFKIIATWFTVGLLIILLNIPWEFSPLVSRPSFRWFY